MFIDEIKVYARAGHGGKGCVAFRRESFAPKGGPIGGNGGHGGNVILQADRDLNNLIAQYYQPRLVAEDGQGGLGKGMDGHAGKDLLVKVPCGTMVWQVSGSPVEPVPEPPTADEPQLLPVSSRQRPVLRTASGARALEIAGRVDAFFVLNHDTLRDRQRQHVDMLEVGRWYLEHIPIPEASNEDQFVHEGMLLTANDSGYNQGYAAFEMAQLILDKGVSPARMAVRTPDRGPYLVNRNRAQQLNIDLEDSMYLIDEIVTESLALGITG